MIEYSPTETLQDSSPFDRCVTAVKELLALTPDADGRPLTHGSFEGFDVHYTQTDAAETYQVDSTGKFLGGIAWKLVALRADDSQEVYTSTKPTRAAISIAGVEVDETGHTPWILSEERFMGDEGLSRALAALAKERVLDTTSGAA